MSERRSFQLYKLAKEFVEEAKKLFGRSEKATERVDPAVEGAANATQNVKPKVTPAEAQKARDDRIASEAEALAKANGITSISDKLGSLDPRRIGRDGAPEFDKRLKELSETATQNGLVNATVRADGKGLLSAKKAEEALLRGEPIHPREMRLIQDAKTNEYDIWAKKDAVINRPNAGGAGLGGLTGLGGLSGLQKYGIIGTVAAGAMGWLGVAITGDDPNDPADNNLTHIQRIPYKIGKVTSDEGKEQIKLALAATLENSRRNTAEAEKEAVAASINRSIVGAQTAPPISFRAPAKAASEIESPKTVPERIDALESSFEVTEEEANKLRSAWKTVSQKPNSVKEFADNAKSILDENTNKGIRQPSEAVELVRKLAL